MILGKHVNKFYLKYSYLIIIGVVALLFVNYVQLIIPEIMSTIIDGLKAIITPSVDNPVQPLTIDVLETLMIKLGVIGLIMLAGRFIWRITVFGLGVMVETDLREEMFSYSELLSTDFYNKNKVGQLMALYTNDIQTIKNSFGSGLVMFVDAVFLGSLSFIKMIRLDALLACFASIPLLVLAACGGIIGKYMMRKFEMRQKAYADLTDVTQESFSGISVIKAFVKEGLELLKFNRVNKENMNKNIEFIRFSTILQALIGVFISSITLIIVGYGGYLVYKMPSHFTVGKLVEFISYFSTLTWPMMAIANLINMTSQARASLKRINSLLDHKIEIKDASDAVHLKIKGAIEIKNLSFKYPDSDVEVLKNINLSIKEGERVGIIGKTGSGKTTLVDMLLRIYNPEENKIFIDGVDIMKIALEDLRDGIGYVPQDNFLFSTTIKDNVLLSRKEVTDTDLEDVVRACSEAAVNDNIEEFPLKYDTVLGERGVTLSGGQRQRTSIARALIKNPSILILDDSVSAVDTETEDAIIHNLDKIRKNKTTILVAHRVSTVQKMDKIIILDDGKIVGVGTHEELLKTSDAYNEIVNLQKLEELEGGKGW